MKTNMNRRVGMTAVALAPALGGIAAKAGTALAAGGVAFPVNFAGTSALGAVNFAGTYAIQKFELRSNKIYAVGTLAGQVTGAVAGTVSGLAASIPLLDAASSGD
ncbi:MAG TPA: hypothetical protein VFX49_07160, partial [Chloroflexota bacterium]|nr:hypothetical protein [Chloroflexota bacterium]